MMSLGRATIPCGILPGVLCPFATCLLVQILLLPLPLSAQYEPRLWLEQDGVVIVEAEDVDQLLDPEKWEIRRLPEGFTGSGYVVRIGYGNTYRDPLVFDAISDSGDLLHYRVVISEPGEYSVHLRNIHQEADGDNDVWVSVNRSPFDKVWDHDTGAYTWTEYDKWTFDLEEGITEIWLAGRSAGFGVDRIVLHRSDLPETVWGDPSISASAVAGTPFYPDQSPPSSPSVRVAEVRSSAVELTWLPSDDEGIVTGYDVLANGARIGTTVGTRFTASGLVPGSDYRFTVLARDLAGNTSAPGEAPPVRTRTIDEDRPLSIKKVRRAPVIDGSFNFEEDPEERLESWHNQAFHPIARPVAGTVESNDDCTAGFRAAWDEENLYVLVEVVDDQPFPGDRGDGLRVFIDPNHSQSAAFSVEDRRYRFIGRDRLREGTQRDRYMEGVRAELGEMLPGKRSWHATPAGWFVEMSFPWATLGVVPTEGRLIGFDILVQDEDSVRTVWTPSEPANYQEGGFDQPDVRHVSVLAWAGSGERAGSSPFHLGTVRLATGMPSGSRYDFLPRQVWRARDGVAIVEAEAIDHHPNWATRSEPEGFTGSGYLVWEGPDRAVTADGRGGNDDYSNERQGPQDEWLIVRVLVDEAGLYQVNARNHHAEADGDNDAWVWLLGAPVTDWNPVRRMGDSLRDGDGFTWLDWGVRTFFLKAGANDLYVGGRSRGFGLDRIALYRNGDPVAERMALDPSSPVSERVR